jgi:hypothetical protein
VTLLLAIAAALIVLAGMRSLVGRVLDAEIQWEQVVPRTAGEAAPGVPGPAHGPSLAVPTFAEAEYALCDCFGCECARFFETEEGK